MKSRKNMYILLSSLVFLSIMISIVYAALNTTLTVTHSNVTQTLQSWNVGFNAQNSISASVYGTSSTGRICGTAKATASAVTVADTTLSKPGDRCVWTLIIKNTGSIDAELSSVQFTQPTEFSGDCTISETSGGKTKTMMVCGNIKYKLTTDPAGNSLLVEGNTLAANSELTVYLTALYIPTDAVQDNDIVYSNAKLKLTYSQN